MLVQYKVHYHNEDREPDEPYTLTEYGIVACRDFNDAAEKLDFYYGKDNIYTYTFTPCEDIIVREDLENDFWGEE